MYVREIIQKITSASPKPIGNEQKSPVLTKQDRTLSMRTSPARRPKEIPRRASAPLAAPKEPLSTTAKQGEEAIEASCKAEISEQPAQGSETSPAGDLNTGEYNKVKEEPMQKEPIAIQNDENQVETSDAARIVTIATTEEADEKKQKKMKDRGHAFEEILSSERIYFSNLQFVYWGIIAPLEEEIKKNTGVITANEVRNIFSNWQSLMTFNKELLKALEKRRDVPIETRKVGDTFLELVSLMKLYTQFVNNFDTSNAVAGKCLERPEFSAFIQVCSH